VGVVIVEMASPLYAQLCAMGESTKAETRRRFAEGEPIPEGQRHDGIFWHAVDLLQEGVEPAEALERVLNAARTQCVPPYDDKLARKQFRGAAKFVAEHPSPDTKARRMLGEHRAGKRSDAAKDRDVGMLRRPLSTVVARAVEFLIDRKIPIGTLTLLAGVGGLGKSALALAYAKRVTDAGGNVLIVSYEDAAEQVLRPRFEALGGDLELVHELYVPVEHGGISFPVDLPDLERHVRETHARMILIDPVSASIDLKLDAHRDQDVRVVLGKLAALAERAELGQVLNAHLNKAPSADPYLRINGSTGFYNAARSVLTVTRDPDEPEWHRLVAHHKSNYGPLSEVERWKIEPVTIIGADGPIEVMTMQFVEIAEGVSRDDVLASRPAGSEKLDEAVEFLESALADGEWHDSVGLVQLAVGISERTLRRAALEELQVEHERRGFPSSTWWRLPSHANPSPTDLA
jgi:hypothetical protein